MKERQPAEVTQALDSALASSVPVPPCSTGPGKCPVIRAAEGCPSALTALGSVGACVCACVISLERSFQPSHSHWTTASEKQRSRQSFLQPFLPSFSATGLIYSRWILEHLCGHTAYCLLSRWRNAQLKTLGLATELMSLLSG